MCNVYAPNNPTLQKVFVEVPEEFFFSKAVISDLILGGDWNTTLQSIEKKGGIQWKVIAYRDQLLSMPNERKSV